jgi:hypothetical protein
VAPLQRDGRAPLSPGHGDPSPTWPLASTCRHLLPSSGIHGSGYRDQVMPRPSLLLPLVLSLALSAGCSDVRDTAVELPQQAGSVADQARFCYSVTRALQGIEAGDANRDVLDAAEEVLAQAPDDLREHARTVARALRDAADGLGDLSDADGLDAAADDLREGVRTMCEPRD